MRIQSLILCEYAKVDRGQLTIVGGLIKGFAVAHYPCPLPLVVVVLFEGIEPEEEGRVHEVWVRVKDASANILAQFGGGIEVAIDPDRPAGIPHLTPSIIPLHQATIPGPGQYDIHVSINKQAGEIATVLFNEAAGT